ncbi:MAG TPA: outer membrane protein transport protein [Candidatus Thiothrix moscowensis]|uniref:OmpP1/FadL family transporter n=1 Tax=unclassified Thiothrix TaxID=2636184 RepID=UPI0025D917B5|nr:MULTISPECIES: outer membrane protein transport protein [unclassified Thiothrix]HRJ53249.1 outer membrane protein transport protein [Candidatus Thiothrix moscowensis]HRJ93181.1 outer membrane protein transport protein [Candidatus Thiothrix moscowensis]
MRRAINKTLLASSILLALGSQAAFATNGLAPTGVGMEHRAMGGAGAGYAANTMSMGTNPASGAFIRDGYDVGVEVFMPSRKAEFNGTAVGMPADTEYDGNGKDTFFIPEAGYKKQINEKVSAGVVVYGNGGMNTSYEKANPFAIPLTFPGALPAGASIGSEAGVDYQQLFVSPTISYKINENNAVGISANLVRHKIKVNPGFTFPGHAYNYEDSTGLGATVGWQGKISPSVTAGVSHRTKVAMGDFDTYTFGGHKSLDVPAATTVGVAWQATPKTLVAADIQRIDYAKIDAVKDAFGWDNQTVYKLGVKHKVTDKVAIMAGVNRGKSPVGSEDTTAGVLAPAVVENHVSLGTEVKLSSKSKLIASYVHAFDNTVKGSNKDLVQGSDLFDLSMDQNAVGVAYSVEF